MLKLSTSVVLLFFTLQATSQYGSKERIYSGYNLINQSLETTKMSLNQKGDQLYYKLTLSYQEKGDSAKADFNGGMQLREKVDSLMNHINSLKVFLIAKTEGKPKSQVLANDTIISLNNLENFDDYLEPTKWLIGENKYSPKEGPFSAIELKKMIVSFQEKIDLFVSDKDKDEGVCLGLMSRNLVEGYGNYWSNETFFEKPLSAIITYLSKLQVDIKFSEQEAIYYLLNK